MRFHLIIPQIPLFGEVSYLQGTEAKRGAYTINTFTAVMNSAGLSVFVSQSWKVVTVPITLAYYAQ
jgi:hypothetical protein